MEFAQKVALMAASTCNSHMLNSQLVDFGDNDNKEDYERSQPLTLCDIFLHLAQLILTHLYRIT